MIPLRPCLVCGERTRTTGPRCPTHEQEFQRQRNRLPRRREYRTAAYQAQSREARRRQPWCSLCGAHRDAGADLTWDHQHRQVECRSCNSSHRRNPTP